MEQYNMPKYKSFGNALAAKMQKKANYYTTKAVHQIIWGEKPKRGRPKKEDKK